ncbi:MAG TPA: hypothetical protein PLA68_12630, partial [Panacibacter sp.]|nr:hypothetical protein [Panacibacter sp.]
DTIDNTISFKVKFIRIGGDTAIYFFSTVDFSLIKKQAVSKNAELDNSIIDIYYSDYTMVQGIKIPFQTVSKIKDQVILTITVKKAALNTAIKKKDFKP